MKRALLSLASLGLLVGCAPAKPIEQLGIITSYGADFAEEDKKTFNNTFLYTQFDPQAPQPMETVESKAKTYQDAISKANLKTSYQLDSKHIRMKIFGKEVAKTGIMRLLSTHFRDATEPANLFIAVSDTTANEVLTGTGAVDISKFLYELIENNIEQEVLPKSNFQDFAHKFDDVGIDPVQPVVKLENGRPTITSIGLFQDDRFIDSLTPEETFLVKLLIEDFRAGRREVTLPKEPFAHLIAPETDKHDKEDLHFILSEIKSSNNINLVDKTVPKYTVDIIFNCRLLETSAPIQLKSNKDIAKLEQHLAKQATEKYYTLIEKLKELKVDPIGFGSIYDTKTRNQQLTKEMWREELYPNMDVSFNIDINIRRYGVTQ